MGVDAFGAAVEAVLIKHGKNIINEQFLLNRLANATIDIYASSCVLARCTKYLNELKNADRLSNYKTMSEISKNVCSKNGPVQGGPLGIKNFSPPKKKKKKKKKK